MNEIAPNLRAKINFSKIVWMIFVWVSEYGWTFERHTRCRVEVVNYINMWVWVRRSDCSCFRSYDVDSTFARIRGWKRKKRKTKKYLSQHFVVPLSKLESALITFIDICDDKPHSNTFESVNSCFCAFHILFVDCFFFVMVVAGD